MRGESAAPFFVYAWLSRIWRITDVGWLSRNRVVLGFDPKDG